MTGRPEERRGGRRRRSFRTLLTLRVTGSMVLGVGLVSILSFLALRGVLDRELDASILKVASIQAATVTDDPTGEMRFHEWELTPEEAASIRELNRYAEIWNANGQSLLRTRYITEDLPLDTLALRRASDGDLVWSEGVFQGVPIRSLYYPLERLGQLHERHVLQVAAPLLSRNRTLSTVALLLLAIGVLTGAATAMWSWWLSGKVVRPVDTIIDQAEEIAAGSRRKRIEAFADTREYERLVEVLNRMLQRLDATLEAQRRFTADASHELRSPLTALRGELEVARRKERTPQEYAAVIDSALEETERLSRIAEDLLTLTRSEGGAMTIRPRATDLRERVRKTAERLRPKAEQKAIHLVIPGEAPCVADVDPDLLDRVIWNLLDNAIKFTPAEGTVEVEVTGTQDWAAIEVKDTGPGIPEDHLRQVFERFHRVDDSRTREQREGGTGLGLAIVKAIVELHDGRVVVRNRPSGGAVFQVLLPVQRGERSFHPPVPGAPVPLSTARAG